MIVAIHRITKTGKPFKNPLAVYHNVSSVEEANEKFKNDISCMDHDKKLPYHFITKPDEVEIKVTDLEPGMEISRIVILDEERFMALYDYTREFKTCTIKRVEKFGNGGYMIFFRHIKRGHTINFSFTAHDGMVKIYK